MKLPTAGWPGGGRWPVLRQVGCPFCWRYRWFEYDGSLRRKDSGDRDRQLGSRAHGFGAAITLTGAVNTPLTDSFALGDALERHNGRGEWSFAAASLCDLQSLSDSRTAKPRIAPRAPSSDALPPGASMRVGSMFCFTGRPRPVCRATRSASRHAQAIATRNVGEAISADQLCNELACVDWFMVLIATICWNFGGGHVSGNATSRMRRAAVLAFSGALLLSLWTGACEEDARREAAVYPVSGQVVVDGKPAEGIVVRLHPLNHYRDPSFALGRRATTDASGRFQLKSESGSQAAGRPVRRDISLAGCGRGQRPVRWRLRRTGGIRPYCRRREPIRRTLSVYLTVETPTLSRPALLSRVVATASRGRVV